MVIKLPVLLLLSLLFCPYTVMAMSSLDVEIRNPRSELGKPVYLKIIGHDIQADLSMLSLDALKDQFAIDTIDLDKEKVRIFDKHDKGKGSTEITRQTLSLKLYPRQTGELVIPSFSIGKVSSTIKIIVIQDASTDGTKITLAWKLSSSEVWQREQIIISLTLTTPEQFATIKLLEEDVDGFDLVPLATKRKWTENEQGGKSTITTGWSLLPLKAGSIDLKLPAIEYHLSGVTRRVFYLPAMKTTIRPLPSYLPPTIPVGKIKVRSSISPSGILSTSDLAYWNLSVESKSLTPFWLPPVLRQIKSNDSTKFYPATSKRSVHPDNQGIHGRVDHLIPFKSLKNGFTNLPTLKIQYFDPATGRLESTTHETERPLSISTTARILVALILIIISLYLSLLLVRFIYKRFGYRKQYLNAIQKIRHAETFMDVRAGLRMVARAESWPENLSLSEWAERWRMKYQPSPQFDETIISLSRAYYGNKNKLKSVTNVDNEYGLRDVVENLTRILSSDRIINRQ